LLHLYLHCFSFSLYIIQMSCRFTSGKQGGRMLTIYVWTDNMKLTRLGGDFERNALVGHWSWHMYVIYMLVCELYS
jgi:hypothetical protein